jgi:hypothetical protein
MRRFELVVFGCLLGVAAGSGCVDTSPGIYVPVQKDAGPSDGAPSSSGDAQASACNLCIEGPDGPCRPNYDACQNTPKCATALRCLLDQECFAFLTIDNRLTCGTPCLALAGALAGNDPTITVLGELNVCTFSSCTDVCGTK